MRSKGRGVEGSKGRGVLGPSCLSPSLECHRFELANLLAERFLQVMSPPATSSRPNE